MYANLPNELKFLNQWLCWRYEETQGDKPTKVPYNPRTGRHASVTDAFTWCTFDDAVAGAESGQYNGIGFVFTANDPYAGIDLDFTEDAELLARQTKIYQHFNSYSELSPSGKGLHIIIKAELPGGRKRSSVEIYSKDRFFTMTGNVYNNVPVAERQELATILYQEMSTSAQASTYGGDPIEREPDNSIIQQALNAANGGKFKDLLEGNWQNYYHSQSEADFALVDIIAFYTQNPIQIARIFRQSGLGQRDKAKRHDYVAYMVNKSFDRQLPPVNIEALKDDIAFRQNEMRKQEVMKQPGKAIAGATYDVPVPTGLVGDIAQFIYAQAPRQVPQIAVAAAIGFMAGVCGRSYNISGTGLNQYVVLLAPTGTGKEAMASGIDALMAAIGFNVPSARNFIGPADIASGQALAKYFSNDSKSFVSLIGEFGLFMQNLSSNNANAAQVQLRKMLLDLYNKSGKGKTLGKTIYSDKDKSTQSVAAPSFSILGEGTPESFYGALDEGMINAGLLPRFTTIEYHGPRPPFNEDHRTHKPSQDLTERLTQLLVASLQLNEKAEVIEVQQDKAALKYTKAFDKYVDEKMNNSAEDFKKQLWNRAHIKVLKLSALIAVGENPFNPIVSLATAEWARTLIENDINNMLLRFEKGDIGRDTEETKQVAEVLRVIRDYINNEFKQVEKYTNNAKLHFDKIIPNAYINKRLVAASTFRLDKIGATNALNRTIKSMVDMGMLREVSKNELATKYNTTQRAYMLSDTSVI